MCVHVRGCACTHVCDCPVGVGVLCLARTHLYVTCIGVGAEVTEERGQKSGTPGDTGHLASYHQGCHSSGPKSHKDVSGLTQACGSGQAIRGGMEAGKSAWVVNRGAQHKPFFYITELAADSVVPIKQSTCP